MLAMRMPSLMLESFIGLLGEHGLSFEHLSGLGLNIEIGLGIELSLGLELGLDLVIVLGLNLAWLDYLLKCPHIEVWTPNRYVSSQLYTSQLHVMTPLLVSSF